MAPVSAIRFDMRLAPFAGLGAADQYRQSIEMSRWADGHGFGAVTVSEHHGVDFISAPIAHAGMILGATERARVTVNAVLLPLHDPIRIAEQAATLDLASGGRFTFVAGLGYKVEEFEMAGVDRRRRGALYEEYLTVLRQAWTGDRFEWQGRSIVMTPKPSSPFESVVWAGGSVPASARRAARLRLPFVTMSKNPALGEIYREECDAIGYTGMFMYPNGPSFTWVAEDPDRAWEALGPYALYDATTYHSWQSGPHDNAVALAATTVEELKASGMWVVVTPDECVDMARRNGAVALHPLMGGVAPELGWECLELYADRVLPRL